LQDSNILGVENDPPVPVLRESIVTNTSDPITLTVDLPTATPQSAHFAFYFTELASRALLNDTRIIDINIDSQMMQTVEAEMNKCKVVTLIVSGPTINITLAAYESCTLPPVITAVEVFAVWLTDSVVVVAFQIAFSAKIYVNDVFLFFKNHFWYQHIKMIWKH